VPHIEESRKEMSKPSKRNAQVKHSWGILLGMLAMPVLALMSKLFPAYDTAWTVLGVLFLALILRSAVGFFFPARASSKKNQPAATQAH
jgi:hypothetical protein